MHRHRRCLHIERLHTQHRVVVTAAAWALRDDHHHTKTTTPPPGAARVLPGDDGDDEDDYYDLDADLDCNGHSANEVVRLPHYVETSSTQDRGIVYEKRWVRALSQNSETSTNAAQSEEVQAWVVNLYNRPPGPERWLQMQQEAVGVIDVLFRFPAVDFGSAKGCGLSHLKAGKWFKALLRAQDKPSSHQLLPGGYPNPSNQPRLLHGKGLHVLEDDCLFAPDARARWAQAVADLPDDADLLLGGVHWSDGKGVRVLPHLVKLKDFSATHQCLFRPSAYDKIQGFVSSHEVNIDRFMGAMARDAKLNVYCVLPFTSTQRAGTSHLRATSINDAALFSGAEQTLLKLAVVSSTPFLPLNCSTPALPLGPKVTPHLSHNMTLCGPTSLTASRGDNHTSQVDVPHRAAAVAIPRLGHLRRVVHHKRVLYCRTSLVHA